MVGLAAAAFTATFSVPALALETLTVEQVARRPEPTGLPCRGRIGARSALPPGPGHVAVWTP
jgi:hypothetical protein